MNLTLARKKSKAPARKRGSKKAVSFVPAAARIEEPGEMIPLSPQVKHKLHSLTSRDLKLAYWRGTFLVSLAAAGLLFIQTLSDYLFHLPVAARAIFLVLDCAVFGYLIFTGPIRARKNRLNLERAALLAQKKWPFLRGSLVAAVQLTAIKTGVPHRSARLVEKLQTQVTTQVEKLRFSEVIPSRAVWRLAALAVLAWLYLALMANYMGPQSRLFIRRVFLSNEAFPAQTALSPISKDIVASIGDNVQLEVRAQGTIPAQGKVIITHEDGTQEQLTVASQPDRKGLFTLAMHNVQQSFRYRFQINDARGDEYQVKTRITPLIRSVACVLTYPPYTGLPPQTIPANELSLLAGSTLALRVTASTELTKATVMEQGVTGQVEMKIDGNDHKVATADIPIPSSGLTGFNIALVDKGGVASVNNPIYQIEIVADEPPAVRIVKPVDESLTVTLHSKFNLVFEVSDNYGLTHIALHYEITPEAKGAEEPKPVEAKPIDFDLKQLDPKRGAVSTITYPWNVETQNPPLHEGDTVRYWIEATDNNNVTGPGITQSSSQRLIVVTPEAKRDEILERLEDNADLMQSVIRDQLDLNDQVKGTGQNIQH